MTQITFVAEQLPIPTAIAEKLRRIAGSGSIHLLGLVRSPALDRFYFFSGGRELQQLVEAQREATRSQLQDAVRQLSSDGARVQLQVLEQRDWIGPALNSTREHGGWLALARPAGGHLPAHFWSLVHQSPGAVLLLGPQAWSEPPRIAGGVDPTHEHDRPRSCDQVVIRSTRALAEQCQSSEWQLWHSAFVAPVAREYRRQILNLHHQALRELADASQVSHRRCILLEGAPSERLPREARERHLDILVMGTTARGVAERWITGSTLSAILPQLDCDLCLINTSPRRQVQ